MMQVQVAAGTNVLLREGGAQRWMRVVHALPAANDGTQVVDVQQMDQFGRNKPRRVTLGVSAHIEEIER